MNKWECATPECKSVAIGVGGAVGLRAVGWFFEVGKGLFCPAHRPDPTLERARDVDGPFVCENAGPCRMCMADREASLLQYAIAGQLKIVTDYSKKKAEQWAPQEAKES